ncbi:hypothetical protein EV356DRAFT_563266 [Viridothelium virens]|uniref:Uncharacterized protein n=1 Tax=Viridothelium virens TaxID=1048519 RepID=A0A6A6HNM0_VIRVR|nr:hypothetical protein EV356DRAFT_563266 [Viridothelium virens]
MKAVGFALAATAVIGVSAQASGSVTAPSASPSPTYSTVEYDDCPSSSVGSLTTVTSGITVTSCPLCQQTGSTKKPAATHTTVYTTVFSALCPTGLTKSTYTVTESCTGATPTWSSGPGYVPQGFTTTVTKCTVCAAKPTDVIVTVPCTSTPAATPPGSGPPSSGPSSSAPGTSPPAAGGSSAPSTAPKSSSPGSPAAPPAGPPAGSSPSSPARPPAGPGPGPPASGSRPRYSTTGATTITQQCPGPQCRYPAGTGVPASPAAPPAGPAGGNNTGPVPFRGEAAALTGFLSVALGAGIGAIAFLL